MDSFESINLLVLKQYAVNAMEYMEQYPYPPPPTSTNCAINCVKISYSHVFELFDCPQEAGFDVGDHAVILHKVIL